MFGRGGGGHQSPGTGPREGVTAGKRGSASTSQERENATSGGFGEKNNPKQSRRCAHKKARVKLL